MSIESSTFPDAPMLRQILPFLYDKYVIIFKLLIYIIITITNKQACNESIGITRE